MSPNFFHMKNTIWYPITEFIQNTFFTLIIHIFISHYSPHDIFRVFRKEVFINKSAYAQSLDNI